MYPLWSWPSRRRGTVQSTARLSGGTGYRTRDTSSRCLPASRETQAIPSASSVHVRDGPTGCRLPSLEIGISVPNGARSERHGRLERGSPPAFLETSFLEVFHGSTSGRRGS